MHRRFDQRALRALPILFCAGLVAAACSSSPSLPRVGTGTTTSPHASVPSQTLSTPTAAPPGPSLPATGPLQAGAPIPVSLSATQVTAAEGPDGAVFVAAQDPLNSSPSIVWVVDGNGPAAVAEHVSAGVAALAVDPSDLYIATYAGVTGYDRTSGNEVSHWKLPTIDTANSSNADLLAMGAVGGYVYIAITQSAVVTVYRINPNSSHGPTQLVQGLGAVFGPDGTVYYERNDHRLVALRPTGATAVGPALANAPNGLGGGVQYLSTVVGGAVWVDEPAGQGLDQQWATYSTTTLQQDASFSGSVGESYADTAAGPLVLTSPDVSSPCNPVGSNQAGTWCVSRVTLQGAMSNPLPFPSAVALIGPQPAVISENAANTVVDVTRLT